METYFASDNFTVNNMAKHPFKTINVIITNTGFDKWTTNFSNGNQVNFKRRFNENEFKGNFR